MGRISRKTKQKQLLTTLVSGTHAFFTAPDLFKKAHRRDADIGIATVYRFLKESQAASTLCSFSCNGKIIYSTTFTSHCHFICEKCGATSHFAVKDIGFLQNKLKGSICHFQIEVTGICEECQSIVSQQSL
ncbi:MAG: transcriptional repressor [Candidatus Woesearchaeota archaeon]|nr:transcriptional repressor [Candidatus Woesearchaeota archaeon]